jgi:hypothetical protein
MIFHKSAPLQSTVERCEEYGSTKVYRPDSITIGGEALKLPPSGRPTGSVRKTLGVHR